MGKSLIITEKPSVAQEFAKVLRVSGRNDGYIENGEYVISWCVGLLTMVTMNAKVLCVIKSTFVIPI